MAPTDEDKLSNPPQADSRGADVDYFIRIPASKSAEGIRAQDIAVAIFQYRFLIGILAAVGLVLGGLVVFLAEPVYRAEVLLVTVEDEPGAGLGDLAGQLGGLAQIAGIDLDGKSNVWVPISMLKSRAFSEQFIEDNNLMPIIFSDEWDAEENAWSEKVKDDPPSLWDAYKVFDEDIRGIDWNSTTQLVVLSIKWRDPEVAAVWANDLISVSMKGCANRSLMRQIRVLDTSKMNLKKQMLWGCSRQFIDWSSCKLKKSCSPMYVKSTLLK